MKKMYSFFLMIICLVCLAGCQEIKKAKVAAVEKTLSVVATNVGINDFELPECDDVNFKMNKDSELGSLGIELDIINPECDINEYRDQIIDYIEEAIVANSELSSSEISSFMDDLKPELIDGGYRWSLDSIDKEMYELPDFNFEITLVDSDGTLELMVQISGIDGLFDNVETE